MLSVSISPHISLFPVFIPVIFLYSLNLRNNLKILLYSKKFPHFFNGRKIFKIPSYPRLFLSFKILPIYDMNITSLRSALTGKREIWGEIDTEIIII